MNIEIVRKYNYVVFVKHCEYTDDKYILLRIIFSNIYSAINGDNEWKLIINELNNGK